MPCGRAGPPRGSAAARGGHHGDAGARAPGPAACARPAADRSRSAFRACPRARCRSRGNTRPARRPRRRARRYASARGARPASSARACRRPRACRPRAPRARRARARPRRAPFPGTAGSSAVPASAASSSTSSPTPMSASLPTDTSLAKPRPRAAPRDSTVPSMVPLCETMLVAPAGGDVHRQHRVHGDRAAAAQVDHAHAVRPEHAHAQRLRARDEPLLARDALGAGVGEAVGENGRDRHARLAAVLERALHVAHHDEGVIDRVLLFRQQTCNRERRKSRTGPD